MLQTERLINALNESFVCMRAGIIKKLLKLGETDETLVPAVKNRISLNFASDYYYSLYSPSLCAFVGYRSGLKAVGINDYASLTSAKEFSKACKILNLPHVVGYHAECVPLFNEKKASCYTYAVPLNYVKALENDLSAIREEKKDYVEALVKKINSRLKKYGIVIPIKEVTSISKYYKGGAVTEKHVAKVFADKIISTYKTGDEIINFLSSVLKMEISDDEKAFITAKQNKYTNEDLTRVIYNNLYVFKAGETLRDAEELLNINKPYGAITAYKLRIKKFDEEFLEFALKTLKNRNFEAVAFDDSTLPVEDVDKVVDYIISSGLLPIAVNRMGMPRQVVAQGDMNKKLYDSMLAVVGSAVSASFDVGDGIFGVNTLLKCPNLEKRIELFKNITENV